MLAVESEVPIQKIEKFKPKVSSLPLFAAMCAYVIAVGIHALLVHKLTHGLQWFVLDDAYIHGSIAKNLLRHGTFGITPGVYAAASSSILWPVLLASCFAVFGVHMPLALLLNVALSLATLRIFHAIWTRFTDGGRPLLEAATLFLVVFAGPLVLLTFVGLEHVLQTASVAWLFFGAIEAAQVKAGQQVGFRKAAWVCGSAALATATRFEGCFAAALVCCLLASRRRQGLASAIGLCGAAPVVGFGLYSVLHGASFFPNSLLLKAVHGRGMHDMVDRFVGRYAVLQGFLAVECVLAFVLFSRRRRDPALFCRKSPLFALLTVLLVPVHVACAATGWAYRYEAYLVVLLVFSAGLLGADAVRMPSLPVRRPARLGLGLIAIAVFFFSLRIIRTEMFVEEGVREIYQQQLQSARFLARYYNREAVDVVDVGAVSFLHDGPVLDVYGLASNAVTRLKMRHLWNADAMDRLTQASGAQVAIVYPEHLEVERMPAGWHCMETWTIPAAPSHLRYGDYALISAYPAVWEWTVSIWATKEAAVEPLRSRLAEFRSSLPPAVKATPVRDNGPCLPGEAHPASTHL